MTDVSTPAEAPELRSAFIADLRGVEWRKAGNGEDITFTGSAVVFNSWSEPLWTPLGTFRERIMPGAFDEVLAQKPDVRLLFNHDDNLVLARTKSETLELTADADALRVWARLDPSDPDVQRLSSKMRRGDVDQMSFAFSMDENGGAEDRWYEDDDTGEIRRDVIRVSGLYDVSPVTFPAYTDTTAALRELRAASAAGKIAARAEKDPVGDATDGDTDVSAPAETDPVVPEVDPLAALRAATSEAATRERESYLRLLKELAR